MIPEAYERVTEAFGSSAQIVLDRYDDPEAEEENPILYLVVRTELEADGARQAMNRFDEDWWLANETGAEGHLYVSVEFL